MNPKLIVLGLVIFAGGVVASPFLTTPVSARRTAASVYLTKTLNVNPASSKDLQEMSNMLTEMAKQGWTYVDREGPVFLFRK